MDVVGDLLARDRRSRDIALVTADGRERTYRDLITKRVQGRQRVALPRCP